MPSRFVWDEAKRRASRRKHKLDFAEVARVAWDFALLVEIQYVDGEERELVYAALDGRVVVIAYTQRGDEVRIISMRAATRAESRVYYDETG